MKMELYPNSKIDKAYKVLRSIGKYDYKVMWLMSKYTGQGYPSHCRARVFKNEGSAAAFAAKKRMIEGVESIGLYKLINGRWETYGAD